MSPFVRGFYTVAPWGTHAAGGLGGGVIRPQGGPLRLRPHSPDSGVGVHGHGPWQTLFQVLLSAWP